MGANRAIRPLDCLQVLAGCVDIGVNLGQGHRSIPYVESRLHRAAQYVKYIIAVSIPGTEQELKRYLQATFRDHDVEDILNRASLAMIRPCRGATTSYAAR
jgi:hypothetical protein